MKKSSLLVILSLCVAQFINASAQKKQPGGPDNTSLLQIAGDKISKADFERVYRKNNIKDAKADKKALDEYLELFINYKLKVKEAIEEKYDTSKNFKQELGGYRKQLAQPYLTDRNVTDQLIKEVYERMKSDVRASHILIRCEQDALPKDSLAAYNKAMAVRNRIAKGEDFAKVAKESSEDPSAKDNSGDLGFFTAMQMVYPFESACFTMKKGELSKPVRTRFGYHIIKITDGRPAQGEIHVAHIMVKTPKGMSADDSTKAKAKIDELYKKVKDNQSSFEDLAKQYSDDANSGRNGGVLPWFSTGRMIPEFEAASFAIKNDGDISEPLRSSYGWHIIKRLEKKGIPAFETIQADLKTKVARDSRSEMSRNSMIAKIKKEYKFKEDAAAKNESFSKVDSTLIAGTWTADKQKGMNKTLFSLLDKKYTQEDFASYLSSHQSSSKGVPPQAIAMALYNEFVNESCIAFEESRLDVKYPDFKALMQEYRDGILLFDITDKKVWSKAVKDSAGLANFYNANKSKYMWNERLDAIIYTCTSEEVAKKTRELMANPKMTSDSLLSSINKDSQLNLTIKESKFSKGDNDLIDSIAWNPGLTSNIKKNNTINIVNVKAKLAPEPKLLDEARGLVTADYQAYLEKAWIDVLRKKYTVTVNKDVLGTINP